MTTDDVDPRPWPLPVAVLVGGYVLLLIWLIVAAFSPDLLASAPAWLAWFATPGSAAAMSVGLLLGGGAFVAVLASRDRAMLRVPFLLSAWCAASAMPLAMAAYLPCTGEAPPFWTALTSTLALLLGNFDEPFGPGQACTHAVPLGLQLARLLAIMATLSGATSVLFAVSRSQLDRLAVLRARRLTAVIGLDESSWPVLARLAANRDAGHRTVVLTGDVGALAERARSIGVLVLRISGDEASSLRAAMPWAKVARCYLLSADAGLNRTRAMAVRTTVGSTPDHRLTVVARIDDPWHADDWRKRFIGEPDFVFDAIGTYESTAETLVHSLLERQLDEVVLTGEPPLLLAVCAELSQLGRERQFLDGIPGLPRVTLLDRDADELVADHQVRQQRFAVDPLQVSGLAADPDLRTVAAQVARIDAAGGRAAVIIARAGTRLGTRLAIRHPQLPVFELATGSRPITADGPAVGRLTAFNLALADAAGRSADGWERAARAVHERYRRRFPDAELAMPWDELPREFYRESNRRQLHSILDAMAGLGRSWAPTSPEPPGGPTPDELADASVADRIQAGLVRFGLTERELAWVAEQEHTSWLRQRRADGWLPAAVRSDHDRRHPDLKPWTELDDDARRKTMAGVVDTLFALGALGYRPVPPTPPDEDGWQPFERVGEVRAERLTAPLSWQSADGDRLAGSPGDWLVSDPSGGQRTVTGPSFHAGHRHLDGDRWQRTGHVQARPARSGETVATQEGAVTAAAGGWVVRDADGNQWVVPGEHFEATYRPVTQA